MNSFKWLIACVLITCFGCSWMPTLPMGSTNRIVLLEIFGYARCLNCPAAEQEAFELSSTYPESISVLIYHQSILDDTLSPQPFTDDRAEWYGVHEAPTAFFDGVSKVFGAPGDGEYQSMFTGIRINPSPIEICLESSVIGTVGEIHLSTAVVEPLTEDTLRILTILYEDSVDFIQSGAHDSIFNHVVRAVLPDAEGITCNSEIDTTLSFVNRWDPKMIGLVAFVQNIRTKEILNSRTINRISPISSFNFYCVEDTIQSVALNDAVSYHFHLQNRGENEYDYDISVSVSGDPPADWGVGLCFQGGCYVLPYNGDISLLPGEKDTTFTIDIFSGNESGELIVGFTVSDILTSKTIRTHTIAQ